MFAALSFASLTLTSLCVAARIQDPESADLTSRFRVPDGMRVTRFAESPMLFNPTALDIDDRGRVWLTEAVNYRKWNGRNPGREHPNGERVVILQDTDGDGIADESKVFVEDPDLLAPLGIAVLGGSVYVSCSPNLFVYHDRDGDDVADEREVLLTGFGGRDHDHGLHSVTLGPDGRLWTALGNAGPHVVEDRDGFTLRSGSCYRSGGSRSAPNQPGLRSDDGRVWTMGLVLRMTRDGHALTPIAHNFRNPYEVALDATGSVWLADNDDDGNRSCRTVRVLEGGNHGYGSADGSRMWRADRRPEQDVFEAHWHQADPGVAPAGHRNGGGGPTGVAFYEGGLLPDRFVGTALNADAGRGLVYAHRAVSDPQLPDGAGCGYAVEVLIEPDLEADSDPRARWFRPSDVAVGPDGSIYVADWFDPGVGGHAARDREAYGRILRIAPAGSDPRVDPTSFAEPVAALACPAPSPRIAAWRWLETTETAEVTRTLRSAYESQRGTVRTRLLWLLAAHPPTRDVVQALLEDRTAAPDQRVTAFRALRAAGVAPTRLAELVSTDAAPLRREAAIALRDTPWTDCAETLTTLAEYHLAGDRTGLEALGIGATDKTEELFAALVAKHAAGADAWPDWLAEVAWRLHPRSAVPAFMARALDPRVPLSQRERATTALAFVPSRRAAEAMATLAEAGAASVRSLALHWLRVRATDTWSEFLRADGMAGQFDPAQAELLWQSPVLRVGSDAIELDIDLGDGGERTLWLLVDDAGDGHSHDWASWCDLQLEGNGASLPLHDLPFVVAETGWGSLRRNRSAGGGPLRIGGREFAHGFGTHANARIALRIPAGYRRLTGTVGADEGGTSQSGANTSLRCSVRATSPADRSAFQTARRTLLDESAPERARRAAALALCEDPEGGLLLIRLAQTSDGLPKSLRSTIAEAIHGNPDVTVRALASEHFPRRAADGASRPSVADILAQDGNSDRGREVFFRPAAMCASCHVHGGQGRDLGPDLTDIGKKYDSTALLDAILNPSAGIAFGYESTLIETKDGALRYGFILADGPRIVLKDGSGKRHVLDAKDVVRREVQQTSLMPDTATLALTTQDLADLIAFLQNRPLESAALQRPSPGLGQPAAGTPSFPTSPYPSTGRPASTGQHDHVPHHGDR